MVYIIAECAQGYLQKEKEDSIGLAKWLVKTCSAAGANGIKFQLIYADEIATLDYKYYNLFKDLEIGREGWKKICEIANSLSIDIIFDIFGEKSLLEATNLGVSKIKIHPTDFTNKDFIYEISKQKQIKTIYAGIGGSTLEEIQIFLDSISEKEIVLIHGYQGYPTPLEENCLGRLNILKNLINQNNNKILLGFADHADPMSEESTHLATVALGLGAKYIEKHITLSKCNLLEDHESAISPDEFKNFVDIIRRMEKSMFFEKDKQGAYTLPKGELKYRDMVRRHIVSKKDLKQGDVINFADICLKRSSIETPIYNINEVIGKKLKISKKRNTPIGTNDIY